MQIAEAHRQNPPSVANMHFKSKARVMHKLQAQGVNTREEARKRERQANLDRLEKERLEKERQEREQLEKERLEKERLEREQLKKLIDEKIQKLIDLRIKMVDEPSTKNESAKEYEKEFKLLMNFHKK